MDTYRTYAPGSAPWVTDKIEQAPFYAPSTGFGRAWRCDVEAGFKDAGMVPAEHANIASWVVEAPFAHPVWHSYGFTLVHLRDIPGAPKATIILPGATHEFLVWALDPEKPRDRIVKLGDVMGSRLSPCNFVAQLVADSDQAAISRIEDAIREVCGGWLSPDTDYISQWTERFGDNMIRK